MDKCLIILGGGLSINGELPLWCVDRCKYAIEYYNNNKNRENIKIIVTSAASYHNESILDRNNFIIHECDVLAQYLIINNIPDNIIFKEWTSYDTIGNAYFCKILLTDIFNWKNLLIITNDYHMKRSKEIFEYIFKSYNSSYNLKYYSCPYNNNSILLDKRLDREETSLQKFKNLIKSFKTPMDIHKWLYSKHDCYTSNPKKNDKKVSNLLYC